MAVFACADRLLEAVSVFSEILDTRGVFYLLDLIVADMASLLAAVFSSAPRYLDMIFSKLDSLCS